MTSHSTHALPTFSGQKFLSTHQASVDAILGSGVRPVFSFGDQFYNRDNWPLRIFVVHFCSFLSREKRKPSHEEMVELVVKANELRVNDPYIVIARTPNEMSLPLALALMGGAYHEAWHTKYSRNTVVSVEEMEALIDGVWDRVEDPLLWTRMAKAILNFSNLVEDIRIERVGCRDFPGAAPKMCDLQHFILDQEVAHFKPEAAPTLAEAAPEKKEDSSPENSTAPKVPDLYSLVSCIFRDVGLGYNTPRTNQALEMYQELSPEAYSFVFEGALRPYLEEAINLSGEDDTASLRLAMEILVAIHKESQKVPQDMGKKSNEPHTCPNCGAPAGSLRLRPIQGGQALLICLECGYEEEVALADEEEEGEGEGEGEGIQLEEGCEMPPGKKPKKSKEGGTPQKSEGGETGKDPSDNAPQDNGPQEGGGNASDPNWSGFVQALQDQLENGESKALDFASAFDEAFTEATAKEDADCQVGEMPYRPNNRSGDTVAFVQATQNGKSSDKGRASTFLASVKGQTSFLRARLRNIVRAMEQSSEEHGLRKGRAISSRMLVDSYTALQAGKMPTRAYFDIEEGVDTSMAAAIVMDESGSMCDRLVNATKVFMALTEPLDALGCATMAIGFRHGGGAPGEPSLSPKAHRNHAIHIDVFKAFHERFQVVSWRFANIKATGGTPMADGVQFALEQISNRPETHRVLFVVTDGQPDSGHIPVLAYQIRKAKEAGILVVGVGMGLGTQYVANVFPDHVYSATMEELPNLLVKKLNQIMDKRGTKRGQTYKGLL